MGKSLRCWHKTPSLSLRLLLLILCGWAVYTISTGFIYPSLRSTTTFPGKIQQHHSRQQVNRDIPFQDSDTGLNRPFEKHFQLVPKRDTIHEKNKSTLPDFNNKNNRYEELTVSRKYSLLPREDNGTNGIGERIRKNTSHKNKRFGSQKRSLTYRLREKKYKNASISHQNTINGAGENSRLNKLANDFLGHDADYLDTSSGRKTQARNQPQQSAIDSNKSGTYLRKAGNTANYGLSTSSSTHKKSFATHSYKKTSPIYTGYHQSANQETSPPSHVSGGASEVKLILLWTPLYKGWNFLPERPTAFSHCSQTHCEITSDRNRLKDSDAVIFHIRTMSLLDLPPFHLPHQKWIFFSLEPPPQSYFPGFHFMYGMFNWTMTYRNDSDIVIPYGRVIPGSSSSRNNRTKRDWELLWKKKTRPVVWMVSHCDTYSKREHFVRQLQKFIDVDILGGCGSAVCLYNQTYKCLEAFSRRYKFFLAFENSICDDYVTEKFFRALKYDFVPVVLGGANYKTVAPPGSFINAADFASPKELADHLHRVSENSTLYRTYFKWKSDGYTIEDKPSHCSLCGKLHSLDFKATSTYSNIAKWWVEESHCTKWTLK